MSKEWGVFLHYYDNGLVGEVHVCPCDADGYAKPPHELEPGCPCEPRLIQDDEDDAPLYVHSRSQ